MLLHLLDNGLNSFTVGLDFYNKYLFDENLSIDLDKYYGNLKFAVIGIQNATELVIKKLLSNINDLLIYDMETIDKPDVLKYIGKTCIIRAVLLKMSLDHSCMMYIIM